jgi:hypothetical protein
VQAGVSLGSQLRALGSALSNPSLSTAKLLAEGLVEEIQSRGSLPVWRCDGDVAHTLRITKRGVRANRSLQGGAADRIVGARKPDLRGTCDYERSTRGDLHIGL